MMLWLTIVGVTVFWVLTAVFIGKSIQFGAGDHEDEMDE